MDLAVIKVGGSLTAYPEKLKSLCSKLSGIAQIHRIIVLPGGGEFADTVRALDKRFNLASTVSHRMAILGMDQYGLLLSDLLPNSQTVDNVEGFQKAIGLGKLPIFLPAHFLLNKNPLENSWDVTSDSIAVYFANNLQVQTVILVTDVDGVFTSDPKKFSNAKLISKLSPSELMKMKNRTSVDKYLPNLLLHSTLECYVVNGLYPQRVEAILKGQHTVCTLIKQ